MSTTAGWSLLTHMLFLLPPLLCPGQKSGYGLTHACSCQSCYVPFEHHGQGQDIYTAQQQQKKTKMKSNQKYFAIMFRINCLAFSTGVLTCAAHFLDIICSEAT